MVLGLRRLHLTFFLSSAPSFLQLCWFVLCCVFFTCLITCMLHWSFTPSFYRFRYFMSLSFVTRPVCAAWKAKPPYKAFGSACMHTCMHAWMHGCGTVLQQADETELEMRELQVLRDRQEARSQRPLTQEEQLRAEATVNLSPKP